MTAKRPFDHPCPKFPVAGQFEVFRQKGHLRGCSKSYVKSTESVQASETLAPRVSIAYFLPMSKPLDPAPVSEPTERDHRNAATREAIAARQQAEYDRVYRLALGKFGPGWLPSGRHFLVDKAVEHEARRTGERAVIAAIVYTVRNAAGRKRHFKVTDGLVTECSGYAEGFGAMLQESHPTLRIEVKGEQVAPSRYSLCWAAIETYQPRSAEQLAAARIRRERNKAEREQKQFEQEYPLFAHLDKNEEEGRGR
jgi:hypothetical protein